MQPFDADDFFRRSLLGSFIGFGKRKPEAVVVGTASQQQHQQSQQQFPSRRATFGGAFECSAATRRQTELLALPAPPAKPQRDQHQQHQRQQKKQPPPAVVVVSEPDESLLPRSQYDIYREIVAEAEQIQRSNTVTPLSEYGSTSSGPTSPVFHQLTNQPYLVPYQHHMQEVQIMEQQPDRGLPAYQQPIIEDVTYAPDSYVYSAIAPPPYSVLPFNGPVAPFFNGVQMLSTQEIKQEVPMVVQPMNLCIEDIVKMVVSAMKGSAIGADAQQENPEDILRRKRSQTLKKTDDLQNNQAAARYRQRQREARRQSEKEFLDLLGRNRELRTTVETLEREIDAAKQAVLGSPRHDQHQQERRRQLQQQHHDLPPASAVPLVDTAFCP